MQDGLTDFNKICPNCNKCLPLIKFIHKKRTCNFCYDCRQHIYVACSVCGLRKKGGEMDDPEKDYSVCKKCIFDKGDFRGKQLDEALKLIDKAKYDN